MASWSGARSLIQCYASSVYNDKRRTVSELMGSQRVTKSRSHLAQVTIVGLSGSVIGSSRAECQIVAVPRYQPRNGAATHRYS